MKEFSAQTGGRYTYVDDIVNLQELALAISEIFDDCDNFVVSGCEVSGTTINAGLVYINGKLRRFAGASNIASWPQYIYESNTTESVAYASGNDKVGRTIYSCAIASTVPTTLDEVTGELPGSLLVSSSGATTLKDAFIGKYALLLDATSQSVTGKVTFQDVAANALTVVSQALQSGNAKNRVYFSDGNLINTTQNGTGDVYKVTVEDGTGFCFYVNDSLILTISSKSAKFNVDVINGAAGSGVATLGSVVIDNNNIYNATTASDEGVLNINLIGLDGGSTYYRDTVIGNGKEGALLTVSGSTSTITGAAQLVLNSSVTNGVVLISDKLKTNTALQKVIAWQDKNLETMGGIGYSSASDQVFRIVNNIAAVEIIGSGFVNIGPAIKENGTLLSEKYVLRSALDELISGKANISDVYTAATIDANFALKAGGLAQFVTTDKTQATLRSEIGAASESDMSNTAKLNKYLADMATSDSAKQKIRSNIGAAGTDDFQTKLSDTGWLSCSGQSALYARQIGNIVAIQGTITTKHSGTVFTVPNAIDAPTHAVFQTITFSNSLSWSCSIAAQLRACTVEYCSGSCNKTTYFSMTYMV